MEMDSEEVVEAGGNAVFGSELVADSIQDASQIGADVGNVAHEVEGENGWRGQRPPVVDAMIEKGVAKRSAELEGDMPVRAELATTGQQQWPKKRQFWV